MRRLLGKFLFLPLICTGCVSSIYSVSDMQKVPVKIYLHSGDSLAITLNDANESELLGYATNAQVQYQTNDYGRTYEESQGVHKITVEKNQIKAIKNLQGEDITKQYLPRDEQDLTTRYLGRMADIQTRMYNLYVLGILIGVTSVIVALASK